MATIVKALPGRYAKFLTAAAGIGIVYAQNQFGASNQWVQLAVAVAAALGVLAVPNTPAASLLPAMDLSTPGLVKFKGDISEEYVAALKAALGQRRIVPPSTALVDPPSSASPPPVT